MPDSSHVKYKYIESIFSQKEDHCYIARHHSMETLNVYLEYNTTFTPAIYELSCNRTAVGETIAKVKLL